MVGKSLGPYDDAKENERGRFVETAESSAESEESAEGSNAC